MTDQLTRYERLQETIIVLAREGPVNAQRIMRQRYSWSNAVWARYKRKAIESLKSSQLCLEDERLRAIESFEETKRMPNCSPATRARCDEMIARIRGTFAPTQIDQRSLVMALSPELQRALLEAPSALPALPAPQTPETTNNNE